ncbi:hypothetical protein ASF49_04965 [Methylobacterium sp. Leaf104]|uniref:hypothetical protein n=1 Tax=Methylobacterium TaxID=407 RepID=UPI0006F86716|nr:MULTISPECIES: hypothetical protein [Methylobacterium]KQP38356.1 hypothetical protein ASF49_04965 [Methylobacterium sp. Leaf104]MCI9880239.1 hypothetical protein [Methylobacterium goesingense]
MSIALFALAAVMIVGGIVSVIQGFPFVRLESGLAMTIAGATTASAGAVVLGLAVVAARLRSLAQSLGEARAAPPQVAPFEPGTTGSAADGSGVPHRARPSLAATAASLGAGAGLGASLGAASTRPGLEPTFLDPAPKPPEPSAAEPLLPNLLPAEEPLDRPHAAGSAPEPELRATEDDLFERPAPEPAVPPASAPLFVEPEPEPVPAPRPAPEPVALRPSLVETGEPVAGPADEPEPAPEPPPAEAAPAIEEEPQVVGTYASGGNTYVMYSTGVIEAETPRGRFTFGSLDELKAFVEAGGESDSRGAA